MIEKDPVLPRLILGELRDEKGFKEFLAAISTGHPVKPVDHRELLFEVIRENPAKYGVSLDQVKEILSKVDKTKSRENR
ncbi:MULTISPECIES: hypothetical protein [Paenibacillus]|uniref:hypothetical protein n=1 Tax=Paenibacillus TaxID=44249 RepID=UPI0009A847F1|nr:MULTISPECIES: hypothetical protein [Paenibacillus]